MKHVLLVTSLIALAGAGLVPPPVAQAASGCRPGVGYLVGAAKADITPTVWPVAEAAYSVGRLGYSAAHRFYARSVAIRSCADGTTVVMTSMDSQGFFAAYKEDPLFGQGYGADGIRAAASLATGVPASHLVVTSTHTHNSPDSVGVWGGGSVAANKAPYLAVVKAGAVRAISQAVHGLKPARLLVGTADIGSLQNTVAEAANDPKNYPIDTTMRVLQAVGFDDCKPITTIVNASIHATAAGEIKDAQHRDVIDPDWPGRVASNLERLLPGDLPVVLVGAVGRTQTRFPLGQQPKSNDPLVQVVAFGDIVTRRVGTALATATPVPNGPVAAAQSYLNEEIQDPALVGLFYDEAGVPGKPGTSAPTLGGLMRSVLPPYTTGNVIRAEAQVFRVGNLAFAGVPGEPYPQNAVELAARINAKATFLLGVANDQIGYSPPAYEYPFIALVDGGDEGIFTINPHLGADLVNSHLASARSLGFTTTGSEPYLGTGTVLPPEQLAPVARPAAPEPKELPLRLRCG